MGSILKGYTDEEIIGRIEDNIVKVCSAWTVWKGIELHQDRELVWITSEIPYPLFNAVLRSRLSDDRADDRINGFAAGAKARSLPLAWMVSPLTEPYDIERRLRARNFTPGPFTVGMAADLEGISESLIVPGNLYIEEVRDQEALKVWSDVVTSVYNFPDFVVRPWSTLHTAMGLGPGKPWRHYLARLGSRAVAAATLYLWEDSAFLANVATVSDVRSLGIGTAITLKALWSARHEGYRLVTLCSSRMGLNLYRRLGFREYCRIRFFSLRGPEVPRRYWRVNDMEMGGMG